MGAPDLGFLSVGPFLDGAVRRAALHAALELGILDRLERSGPVAEAELARAAGVKPAQARVLLGLLVGHGVLARSRAGLGLSAGFARALRCRDLLETQLECARGTETRVQRAYAASLRDGKGALAELAGFFHYDPDPAPSEAAVKRAEPWVRYMSVLTRYQAPLLVERLGLAGHRRVLDVGGNSGELALALCRAAPRLEVTVADLPAVCRIGERRVRAAGLSARVRFAPLDALRQELPAGADLIVFKSFLHDFSDDEALGLLDRAARALAPGGRIAVFEMHARDLSAAPLPDREIVNLPFFTVLRRPAFYADALAARGFPRPAVEEVAEIHFSLVATRPRPGRRP